MVQEISPSRKRVCPGISNNVCKYILYLEVLLLSYCWFFFFFGAGMSGRLTHFLTERSEKTIQNKEQRTYEGTLVGLCV